MGDPVGRRVSKRVRTADDEAVEGETRIEGRAAKLVSIAALVGDGCGHGFRLARTGHTRKNRPGG